MDRLTIPNARGLTVASYNLVLPCGCTLYVACHPVTRVAHTRIIERHSAQCRERRDEVGARISLWELLPTSNHRAQVEFLGDDEGLHVV